MNKSYQHLIVLVSFLLISSIYFAPTFSGKVLVQSDMIGYEGKAKEIKDFQKEYNRTPLWSNAIFGGMPSYMVVGPYKSNLFIYFNKLLGFFKPISMFMLMAVCFYLLMIYVKVRPWIAGLMSVAFAFSTYYVAAFEAGHISKLYSIAYFPIILLSVLKLIRKEYLSGTTLLALAVTLSLMNGHYQMIYYFFLALIPLVFIELYKIVRENDYSHLLKLLLGLTLSLVIGIGTSFSKLYTSQEYAAESIRGKAILSPETLGGAELSNSASDGLGWAYAMEWSHNFVDLASTVIPGYAGGSGSELIDSDYKLFNILKQNGRPINDGKIEAPLYWGGMPFTGGPSYLGVTLIFLFLFGAIAVKHELRVWLIVATGLMLLLSLGKYLSWFQEPFFNYLPYYNRFRAPSSIVTVAAFTIPVLAGLGLERISKMKKSKKLNRDVFIAVGISIGTLLVLLVIGMTSLSFTGLAENYPEQVMAPLKSDRAKLLTSDGLRSIVLVLLTSGLVFLKMRQKIKLNVMLAGLTILVLYDFGGINMRYFKNSDFITKSVYSRLFAERPVDQQIKSLEGDRSLYRVYEESPRAFRSNTSSYHHNMIGGYHPAKMQRMQDLLDGYIGTGVSHPAKLNVLNMLNAKYIVKTDGTLTTNTDALGHAWIVSGVKGASTADQEFQFISNIDLRTNAVVHEEFLPQLANRNEYKGQGNIRLIYNRLDELKYESKTTSPELVVFSEMWYGKPGWNAYIDGNRQQHIRANYALRALEIPAGEHDIEFRFEPKSFYTGELVSFISSLLLILFALYLLIKDQSWFPSKFRTNLA